MKDLIEKHWRLLEALVIVAFVLYGTVLNAREVPVLRDRVLTLEANYGHVLKALERIETKLDKRR